MTNYKRKSNKILLFLQFKELKTIFLILLSIILPYISGLIVSNFSETKINIFVKYILGIGAILVINLAIFTIVGLLYIIYNIIINIYNKLVLDSIIYLKKFIYLMKIKYELLENYSRLPLTIEEVKTNNLSLYEYLELILKSSSYDLTESNYTYSTYKGDILSKTVRNKLLNTLFELYFDELFSKNLLDVKNLLYIYKHNSIAQDLLSLISNLYDSKEIKAYKKPIYDEESKKYIYFKRIHSDTYYSEIVTTVFLIYLKDGKIEFFNNISLSKK